MLFLHMILRLNNVLRRDSYFSHCKDRSYSGVATYCRKAVTIPVAAEQGITGSAAQLSVHSLGSSPHAMHIDESLGAELSYQHICSAHKCMLCMRQDPDCTVQLKTCRLSAQSTF